MRDTAVWVNERITDAGDDPEAMVEALLRGSARLEAIGLLLEEMDIPKFLRRPYILSKQAAEGLGDGMDLIADSVGLAAEPDPETFDEGWRDWTRALRLRDRARTLLLTRHCP